MAKLYSFVQFLKESLAQYCVCLFFWYALFCVLSRIVSECDKEIPQSQTADNPMAPRGRATRNVQHAWKPSNLCNSSSWRNTLITLTHHDETKKRDPYSQIVRAKEILKLSHGGFCYHIAKEERADCFAFILFMMS